MGNGADEFYLFSADELLSASGGQVNLDTNRVVGFEGEYGAGVSRIRKQQFLTNHGSPVEQFVSLAA